MERVLPFKARYSVFFGEVRTTKIIINHQCEEREDLRLVSLDIVDSSVIIEERGVRDPRVYWDPSTTIDFNSFWAILSLKRHSPSLI